MKIICFVSSAIGHLDFGGMGYIKLAMEFLKRRHHLAWMAPSNQCSRLAKTNFPIIHEAALDYFRLDPFFSVNAVGSNRDEFEYRLHVMQDLYKILDHYKPDIILVDRVLPLVNLVASQLEIPAVAIGSPGGCWVRNGKQVRQSPAPVPSYQEVGELIISKLGWINSPLTSYWSVSTYANICFMGRNYYSGISIDTSITCYTHHFDMPLEGPLVRTRYGISYGNSGDIQLMTKVENCIRTFKSASIALDVFSSNQRRKHNSSSIDYRDNVHIHGWINFADYFPLLSNLVFFGGIGTIWSCINHDVPMLVMPGGIGDQLVNAENIYNLGMGRLINGDNINCKDLQEEVLTLAEDKKYIESINYFKDRLNYTDTIATVVDKLEILK